MSDKRHAQCTLSREGITQVARIPSKFAKLGKKVNLKIKDEWSNGGEIFVGLSSESEEVLERTQDYKHQREASDV